MFYDAETNDPMVWLKSFEFYVDIDKNHCRLTYWNKEKTDLFSEDVELVSIEGEA